MQPLSGRWAYDFLAGPHGQHARARLGVRTPLLARARAALLHAAETRARINMAVNACDLLLVVRP